MSEEPAFFRCHVVAESAEALRDFIHDTRPDVGCRAVARGSRAGVELHRPRWRTSRRTGSPGRKRPAAVTASPTGTPSLTVSAGRNDRVSQRGRDRIGDRRPAQRVPRGHRGHHSAPHHPRGPHHAAVAGRDTAGRRGTRGLDAGRGARPGVGAARRTDLAGSGSAGSPRLGHRARLRVEVVHRTAGPHREVRTGRRCPHIGQAVRPPGIPGADRRVGTRDTERGL